MGDSVLVADSGYRLQKYMMTPFSDPQTEGQNRYNESQIHTRNPVERSYGVWKRRFPILSVGINLRNRVTVQSVIVATAVLHNIACHFGEQVPRCTRSVEALIALTNAVGGCPPPGTNNTSGARKRNEFVAYFKSM